MECIKGTKKYSLGIKDIMVFTSNACFPRNDPEQAAVYNKFLLTV